MPPKTSDLERIRNFGIAAHIDAGKTTVSERILYYTGREHRMGEVHEGTATMDWMEEEQERGITITAAATNCFWGGFRLQLVDTPGHVDFTAEVERCLRVLDGAVIVFDCLNGVEAQSETVWRQANRYRVPRLVFMNKLDRPGADPAKCLEDIRKRLGANAVAIQIPIGKEKEIEGVVDLIERREIRFLDDDQGATPQIRPLGADLSDEAELARAHLVEKVAEVDEQLLERFVAGEEVDGPTLKAAIRRATLRCELVPALMGAAFKNRGIQPLLDSIVAFLPSPLDLPPVKGFEPEKEKEASRKPTPSEPLCALVFKIFGDAHGDLSYARIYSGVLKAGELVYNARTGKPERANRILRMHANHREPIEEASVGDIVALPGLKETVTGDTLFSKGNPIQLEKSQFPEPVISMALEPKNSSDRDKLLDSLKRLEREDPTFRARTDAETGQVLIAGMGELHLEVLRHRLEREHRVLTNAGKPFVSYRETIRGHARGEHRFERELGGKKLFGHVILEVFPQEEARCNVSMEPTALAAIPKMFHASVERSVREALESGANFAYPVVNVKVTIVGGSIAPESAEVAYQAAASEALQSAMRDAGGELLEPILRFEIRTPPEYLSGVLNDLQSRRGIVEDLGVEELIRVVRGTVPAGETFGYTTALRSLSQGRASAALEPCRYAPVPDRIRREVTGE